MIAGRTTKAAPAIAARVAGRIRGNAAGENTPATATAIQLMPVSIVAGQAISPRIRAPGRTGQVLSRSRCIKSLRRSVRTTCGPRTAANAATAIEIVQAAAADPRSCIALTSDDVTAITTTKVATAIRI